MRKKIFLAFAYSQKNAGDLAITVGALDLLLGIDDFDVMLLSRYDKNSPEYRSSKLYYDERYRGRVLIIPCPFVLDRQSGFLKNIYYHIQGILFLLGIKKDNAMYEHMKSCDFIIFNGGNLLRSASLTDFIRLQALNYPLKIGRKLGKNYYIFPQSSSTIKGYGTVVIQEMLEHAKTVFTREELTFNALRHKFNLGNLVQAIDLAFFIDKGSLPALQVRKHRKIAFTFRAHSVGDLYELSRREKEKISAYILDFISELNAKDDIFFVVQTRKDLTFTTQLKRKVENQTAFKIKVFENYDPVALIRFYASIDLLVGMRLHSIILAISAGIPCYGLFYSQWGLKNPGVMRKFNLPFKMLGENDTSTRVKEDVSICYSLIANKDNFKATASQIIEHEFSKFKEILK